MTNTEYAAKEVTWNELYYGSLIGATATKVEVTRDDYGDLWTKITFEKGEETFEVEVSQDEEGNGPGFLFGLAMPSDEENPFVDN